MRNAVKEKKKPKLAEFSFIVPDFKPAGKPDSKFESDLIRNLGYPRMTALQDEYNRKRLAAGVTYNHFISMQDERTIKFGPTEALRSKGFGQQELDLMKPLIPNIVNGYDGFGGAHDNLLWMPTQGKIFYTLNNKLIEEDTKVRKQVIYADSEVRLSCLAHNVHNAKYIAVGEGEPNLNSQFESFIWVYDMSI
jgi:hypothetical protein